MRIRVRGARAFGMWYRPTMTKWARHRSAVEAKAKKHIKNVIRYEQISMEL